MLRDINLLWCVLVETYDISPPTSMDLDQLDGGQVVSVLGRGALCLM